MQCWTHNSFDSLGVLDVREAFTHAFVVLFSHPSHEESDQKCEKLFSSRFSRLFVQLLSIQINPVITSMPKTADVSAPFIAAVVPMCVVNDVLSCVSGILS